MGLVAPLVMLDVFSQPLIALSSYLTAGLVAVVGVALGGILMVLCVAALVVIAISFDFEPFRRVRLPKDSLTWSRAW
jgi:hypothetical protein